MAREDLYGHVEDASSDWSPDFIYTGSAADKNGHSAHTRVYIPTGWVGRINEIVFSQSTPYRSPQDFYRDAVHSRMTWFEKSDHQLSMETREDIAILRIQTKAAMVLAREDSARKMVEDITESLKILVNSGERIRGKSFIKETRDEITYLAEPWRSQARTILDDYQRRLDSL